MVDLPNRLRPEPLGEAHRDLLQRRHLEPLNRPGMVAAQRGSKATEPSRSTPSGTVTTTRSPSNVPSSAWTTTSGPTVLDTRDGDAQPHVEPGGQPLDERAVATADAPGCHRGPPRRRRSRPARCDPGARPPPWRRRPTAVRTSRARRRHRRARDRRGTTPLRPRSDRCPARPAAASAGSQSAIAAVRAVALGRVQPAVRPHRHPREELPVVPSPDPRSREKLGHGVPDRPVNPRRSEIDRARSQRRGPDPPADPVARLEDHDLGAGTGRGVGHRQPRHPGSDDDLEGSVPEGPRSAGTSTACSSSASRGTISRARSWVDASTT